MNDIFNPSDPLSREFKNLDLRLSDVNVKKNCPHCNCDTFCFRKGTHPHYGRQDCTYCGKFICWISEKEFIDRGLVFTKQPDLKAWTLY